MGKEWQILECLKEICNKVFAFWVMLLHLFFTAWDFEVFGNLFQFVFVGNSLLIMLLERRDIQT